MPFVSIYDRIEERGLEKGTWSAEIAKGEQKRFPLRFLTMNKKKRLEWILGGNFGSDAKFDQVCKVLEDLEYKRIDTSAGSHFVFCRNGEEEQKTIPAMGGRKVKKVYLKKIRENAQRILGGQENGCD